MPIIIEKGIPLPEPRRYYQRKPLEPTLREKLGQLQVGDSIFIERGEHARRGLETIRAYCLVNLKRMGFSGASQVKKEGLRVWRVG